MKTQKKKWFTDKRFNTLVFFGIVCLGLILLDDLSNMAYNSHFSSGPIPLISTLQLFKVWNIVYFAIGGYVGLGLCLILISISGFDILKKGEIPKSEKPPDN